MTTNLEQNLVPDLVVHGSISHQDSCDYLSILKLVVSMDFFPLMSMS